MSPPLSALYWSYCAFIAYASGATFWAARGQGDVHLLLLSGVELAAIVAFVFVPIAACAVLLVVFTAAAVLTAMAGELPLRFVYYAATAVYLAAARPRLYSASLCP